MIGVFIKDYLSIFMKKVKIWLEGIVMRNVMVIGVFYGIPLNPDMMNPWLFVSKVYFKFGVAPLSARKVTEPLSMTISGL